MDISPTAPLKTKLPKNFLSNFLPKRIDDIVFKSKPSKRNSFQKSNSYNIVLKHKVMYLISILLTAFVFSCTNEIINPSRYGKVSIYKTSGKDTFIFSVNEQFLKQNRGSKKDKLNPKISEAEAKLLAALLAEESYCSKFNDDGINFRINSVQEKIYDITFAHLIEQNYNVRPVAPRMYFGECL